MERSASRTRVKLAKLNWVNKWGVNKPEVAELHYTVEDLNGKVLRL